LNKLFNTIGRKIIPKKIRIILWECIPKFFVLNTYFLSNPKILKNIKIIDEKYYIRFIDRNDKEKLQNFYNSRRIYEKKIPYRLSRSEWKGIAVYDQEDNSIAYLSWIIDTSIPYFEEFGITLKKHQYLLKDGHCKIEHRHKGLHTRMEQERINYCAKKYATDIFIQIHNSNEKGKQSVLNNGYYLYKQNIVIQWPIFNIYRRFSAFLINPFRKVIK
jgi:hypothetical protein